MEVGAASEKRTNHQLWSRRQFLGGFAGFFKLLKQFDLGVFCIVIPTWLIDNGTGVSGYLSIIPMSTSASKAWYKMLPK